MQETLGDDTVSREALRADPDWQRSVGKKVLGVHYRERDGTRHAVCPWGSDTCYVHEDAVNPHAAPVRHLLVDAPEILVLAGVGLLFGPKAVQKLRRLVF